MNKYEDIINTDYEHIRKPRMSQEERSAQFAPFQSLNGYSDDVYEAERITQSRITLDEDKKEELNNQILYLYNNNLEGVITYFVNDYRKKGGSYKEKRGIIKKLDYINQEIVFEDKFKLKIDSITNIELN